MFKEAHHLLTLPNGFHDWDQPSLLPNWTVHFSDPAGILWVQVKGI